MSKNITIELTEAEARMVRWAVTKARMTTSARERGVVPFRSLETAETAINAATAHVEELPIPVPLPRATSRR